MNSSLVTALLERLARGPSSAASLTRELGVSQSTLSRTLQPLERGGRVVRIGKTRGARYGLAREIGSVGSAWPLYIIDEDGTPTEIAVVHALALERFYVRGGPQRVEGLAEGFPYFLQDARPAGFLGRAIAAAHPELGLPARVTDWTDEHGIIYLTQRGSEGVGNLIVGAEALNRYLSGEHGPRIVRVEARSSNYPAIAAAAMSGAPPGSSAHGEHPKFSVRLAAGQSITPMLVKFSPPRTDAVGQRWADLLIAEHLASVVLADSGIDAARSELLEFEDQVFLQSQRFDRVGADGRRGVVSLYSVDLDRYGKLDTWTQAAARLCADGLLSDADAERVTLLDTFGTLIANTDRHFGNITLFDPYEGPFSLAPAYDMLPMLFAPQDGHIVERSFEPSAPTAATLAVWPRARAIAERYWARLCEEPRLTAEFRERSARCLESLRALPPRGTPRRAVIASTASEQS